VNLLDWLLTSLTVLLYVIQGTTDCNFSHLTGSFSPEIEEQLSDNSVICFAAISNNGRLFVTDFEKNCIFVFQ